jgi:putative two-component system response regulator
MADPVLRPSVLLVDDEANVRTALARLLASRGYRVSDADGGSTALEKLAAGSFDIMLADVYMPEMTGVELVTRALAVDEDLAIVMLSGVNDVGAATEAMRRGALDYLLKPASGDQLETALDDAMHRRRLNVDRRRVERMIRDEVQVRTADLQREQRVLRSLTLNVVQTLINAMEAKDIYLRGHSVRVAELGASIAEEMGLDEDAVEHVRLAGHVHDVGKMGVREEVLNKPGPLTADEYDHVKEHVRIGMEILAPLRHLGVALDYVHDHHEQMDGSGYPRGLAGVEISLGGRILAAADSYDAMTSRRAYRDSMTQEATLAHLKDDAGRKLDERVFAALERVVTRRQTLSFIQ